MKIAKRSQFAAVSVDADKMRDAIAERATMLFAALSAAWGIATLALPGVPGLDFWFAVMLTLGSIWPLIAAWAIVPLAALILAVNRFRARRFVAAGAWLSVPAAAVLIYFTGSTIADVAHFWLEKESYERVLADARADRCETNGAWGVAIDGIDCHDPITIIFVWGGFGSIWHGVIYDAADEIAKRPQERSETWRKREIGELLACSGVKFSLGDHYYRAGGNYAC